MGGEKTRREQGMQPNDSGPKCPDCRTPMVERGEVAGSLGVGIVNFTSTLYQCPKCKTVTVGDPDEPDG